MASHKKIENFLIYWNLRFPLDREFRKSNHIVFGSEKHRAINQINLYLQYREDVLYNNIIKDSQQAEKDEKEYKQGKWLKDEQQSEEDATDLFNQLKIEDIKEDNE